MAERVRWLSEFRGRAAAAGEFEPNSELPPGARSMRSELGVAESCVADIAGESTAGTEGFR